MMSYIAKRLALIPLTLLLIMAVNFAIVQTAPGGPVELVMSRLRSAAPGQTLSVGGGGGGDTASGSVYRGGQGLEEEARARLTRQFGFDKPLGQRFWLMMKAYAAFDFGESFYRNRRVIDLIWDKLPVSASLGILSTLLVYLIAIPLGIAKAVRAGTAFDKWTSAAVVAAYAVPSFLLAIFLVVLLAGGSYLSWFPLKGLTSDNFAELSAWGRLCDWLWHLALPVASLAVGGIASLAWLTRGAFLEELGKTYVAAATAKGISRARVLWGHVFRNAMLVVIAGFPSALVGMLFTGSVLVEIVFSLDGLGLLGFTAVSTRDYPVIFGTLYMFTLLGLLLNLISDLTYRLIDPRLDFKAVAS
ncbi:ABC transporter permease [Alphaproteobacteria bacterium]|nr:ABC transporter permease [Alphaproteobacteria bacterium]